MKQLKLLCSVHESGKDTIVLLKHGDLTVLELNLFSKLMCIAAFSNHFSRFPTCPEEAKICCNTVMEKSLKIRQWNIFFLPTHTTKH